MSLERVTGTMGAEWESGGGGARGDTASKDGRSLDLGERRSVYEDECFGLTQAVVHAV